jgi:hypothetical protein
MALKALCRLGSWNQSEGEKSEIGGVRLYPSCPICLITASIIALRSARLAAQPAASIASAMRHPKRFHALSRHPQGAQSVVHFRPIPIQVARGRLSKQIAHDIGIAEATVKVHRSRAMRIYIIYNGQPSVR